MGRTYPWMKNHAKVEKVVDRLFGIASNNADAGSNERGGDDNA